MILQTLVETLVQHEPDEVDQVWAQRLVEAIPELLAEVPEEQETRKQRAVLLTHQGLAHMMLSFAPGAKVRESQRAVEVLREAQRLMAEVGDEQDTAFVADHLEGAEQLLAIAEREDHPRSLSIDEVDAWLDAERDSQSRVERLERLLTEGTMKGGTAEGAALYRLDLAGRLLREIQNTIADVELVISVAEQALSTLDDHSNPALAFVGHDVLGVAYMIRAAGERAANLELALSHLERCLQLNPFKKPEDQAELLLSIAFVLKDRSGGDRSRNIERALECARAALDAGRGQGDAPSEADARMILGVLYGERIEGRSDENSDRAVAELTRAIELLDADRDRINWGSAQHNLGRIYAARRWIGASEENLRRAIYHYRLSLAAHPRAERPYDWATSQLTLANAYSQLAGDVGDPLAGQEFLQQAVTSYLAAAEVFNRSTSPHAWAGIQANLGATFADPQTAREPDPQRAAVHFRAALEVITRDSDLWLWAWCTSGLGAALAMSARDCYAHGDHEAAVRLETEAKPLLRQGMDAMQAAGTRVEWARAATFLLELLTSRGREDDPAQPQEEIGLGYRILEVFEGEGTVRGTSAIATRLAETLSGAGRWDEAADIGLRGLASLEVSYRAALLRATKRAEMSQLHWLVEVTVVALLRAGRLAEAVLTLERGRARELAEALARDRADLTQLAKADPGAYEEYRHAVEMVTAVETAERMAVTGPRHQNAPGTGADPSAAEQGHLSLLTGAQRAVDQLERAVQRVQAVEGFKDFLAPPERAAVEAAVFGNQLLLYLLPAQGGTEIIALSRGSSQQLQIQAWTLPQLDRSSVAAIARVITPKENPGQQLRGHPISQETREHFKAQMSIWMTTLGEKLTAPLAEKIADIRPDLVALIPCGLLGLFPLACIPYDKSGRCLLDDYETVVAPSAAALAASQAAVSRRQAQGAFIGVGDPTGDLPFARAEMTLAARQLPTSLPCKLLLGGEATVAEVEAALVGSSLAHFACHAAYDPHRPLESAFILADGAALTLRELISKQAFQAARLVTASACRTGTVGTTLPDEATGLATGLLQARLGGRNCFAMGSQ